MTQDKSSTPPHPFSNTRTVNFYLKTETGTTFETENWKKKTDLWCPDIFSRAPYATSLNTTLRIYPLVPSLLDEILNAENTRDLVLEGYAARRP